MIIFILKSSVPSLRHRGCPLLEHFLLHLLLLRRRHVRVPGRQLELLLFHHRRRRTPRPAPRMHLLLLHHQHLLFMLLRLRGFQLNCGHLLPLPARVRLRVVQALLHRLLHVPLLLLHQHHVLLLLMGRRWVTLTAWLHALCPLRVHVTAYALRCRGAANNRRSVAHHHVPARALRRHPSHLIQAAMVAFFFHVHHILHPAATSTGHHGTAALLLVLLLVLRLSSLAAARVAAAAIRTVARGRLIATAGRSASAAP